MPTESLTAMEKDADEVMVSVICSCYNHEPYIRKALDSFVMQKTSFKYEVIVHDDASTDKSADIIREFEAKYPDIIKPIYQTENQYSKGVKIAATIICPKARGKYIAICEGDDCWCDENKLQRQADYMEQHPECSLCLHNTIWHDLTKEHADTLFNNWSDIHILLPEEILDGVRVVQTSSFFCRKADFARRPEILQQYWAGDFTILTFMMSIGNVVCLPYVMSIYNCGVVGGAMWRIGTASTDVQIQRIKDRIDYLNIYNAYTGGKYDALIKKYIAITELNILEVRAIGQLMKSPYCKRKVVPAFDAVIHHEQYNRNECLPKTRYKFEGYKHAYYFWATVVYLYYTVMNKRRFRRIKNQ